ncbi:MAG: hypothetical protein U0797_17300 [Gemmataceae bacterium]
MTARRFPHFRQGRCQQEHMMVLAIIIVVCLAAIRVLSPEQPADARPLWDRVLASVVGLFQCFGLVVLISVVLASVEVMKQTVARYRSRRVESKLAQLDPLLRDARPHATPQNLTRVLRDLRDGNEEVRRQALSAAFTLVRADPSLPIAAAARELFEEAILHGVGFARAMAMTPPGDDLLARVTLGAKLGAGTSEKRLAPVTSSPATLAQWIESHRREEINPEVQVSVGYDTSPLPYLVERARFLALYLYVSTTDLKRFQALLRRPPRDPNAAYGLVIRGDVVEVKYPGQSRGHRLDYVFPLPVRLSEANLAGLVKEIQLLNLGLLVACVQDLCRVLLPGAPPAWLGERREAVAGAYRAFERKLVAALRAHDRHRDPARVHRLVPADHAERVRAFESHRLEECLYPHYSWVVPLYDPDTRWERLLAPLRGVEGMLLHQGPVEGRDVTRGVDFLHQVRRVGYEAASAIEQALAGDDAATPTGATSADPFLDPANEEATVDYLRQVSRAVGRGECCLEDLPDPVTFRRAAAYYEVEAEPSTMVREGAPEDER